MMHFCSNTFFLDFILAEASGCFFKVYIYIYLFCLAQQRQLYGKITHNS